MELLFIKTALVLGMQEGFNKIRVSRMRKQSGNWARNRLFHDELPLFACAIAGVFSRRATSAMGLCFLCGGRGKSLDAFGSEEGECSGCSSRLQ